MIPKPKRCGQKWEEMEQTSCGRICVECNKLITDFTKMKWSKIESIQLSSDEPVCGMYSDNQLKYWGKEVPSVWKRNLNCGLTVVALLTSLNLFAAESKPIIFQNGHIKF